MKSRLKPLPRGRNRVKHLLKDVSLFRRVAEGAGMDTAMITTLEAACMRALGQGYGDQDYSVLYEAMAAS